MQYVSEGTEYSSNINSEVTVNKLALEREPGKTTYTLWNVVDYIVSPS